ncbi:MAG: hypothetical protein JW976_05500 [Syntrophaceae bacterium]|nr:hypothetical protein [Syntrophaceae bacterium]
MPALRPAVLHNIHLFINPQKSMGPGNREGSQEKERRCERLFSAGHVETNCGRLRSAIVNVLLVNLSPQKHRPPAGCEGQGFGKWFRAMGGRVECRLT